MGSCSSKTKSSTNYQRNASSVQTRNISPPQNPVRYLRQRRPAELVSEQLLFSPSTFGGADGSAPPRSHLAQFANSRHAVPGSSSTTQECDRPGQSTNQSFKHTPNHNALLDQMSLFRFEIDGLEALNSQSCAELNALMGAPYCVSTSDSDAYEQVYHLTKEVRGRHEEIEKRHQIIAHTKEALQAHGLCLNQPSAATAFVKKPEDEEETLCQFCVSNPIDVLFTCCNYRGACHQCFGAMREDSPKCPSCRAQQPHVLRE